MLLRCSLIAALCLAIVPPTTHAASKTSPPTAKIDQELIHQIAKLGVKGTQVRALTAAMKQDAGLGDAVKSAIDKGLRGRDLADFVTNEIANRQAILGQQPGMGQGMMGSAAIGQSGTCPAGMSQGMAGSAMGRGMMGARGMGMGRSMRGGR
jgi:hypothetical protein